MPATGAALEAPPASGCERSQPSGSVGLVKAGEDTVVHLLVVLIREGHADVARGRSPHGSGPCGQTSRSSSAAARSWNGSGAIQTMRRRPTLAWFTTACAAALRSRSSATS